jgi:hypothetical protein
MFLVWNSFVLQNGLEAGLAVLSLCFFIKEKNISSQIHSRQQVEVGNLF